MRGIAETLWLDVRNGLGFLLPNRGFAAVAILTLALGIGANTAIFSFVNAALLRQLPFGNPDRLVGGGHYPQAFGTERLPIALPYFLDWKSSTHIFVAVALMASLLPTHLAN